jgi:hypothetical protein
LKPLILVVLALPLISQAQLTKGTWYTGGSASFNDQNVQGRIAGEMDNNTTFGLTPKVGYMVSDKWAVGLTMGYSGSHSTYAPVTQPYGAHGQLSTLNVQSSSNIFSSGIFTRRFFPISDKFLFTLDGAVNFSRANSSNTTAATPVGGGPTTTDRENAPYYSVGVSLRPLFIFFPSPRWGLEAGLGSLTFSHQHSLNGNSYTAGENFVTLGASSSTSVGIYYYFNRK